MHSEKNALSAKKYRFAVLLKQIDFKLNAKKTQI